MISIAVSTFDKRAINLVSRLPPSLRPFFRIISHIGHPIPTSCIGGGIALWGIVQHSPALFFSGASVWIALLISTVLKRTIERSRPLTEYVTAMRIPSFSFPSGHTTGSTVSFGLLAYFAHGLLPHPFSYIVFLPLAALIILVGLSRVYLGAHYPTDVVGGWALGGIILTSIIFVIKPLT